MFIIKNNYYLYIENTKNINLNHIKSNKKISIIYRPSDVKENIVDLIKFKNHCKIKGFKFYIANNSRLFKNCKADGLYLSSYNKKIYLNTNITLIGSAHCFKEINEKIKQGCRTIFLSRLFKTSYETVVAWYPGKSPMDIGFSRSSLMIYEFFVSGVPQRYEALEVLLCETIIRPITSS